MNNAFDSNISYMRLMAIVRKAIYFIGLLFFFLSFNSVCYGYGNKLKCSGTIEDSIECDDPYVYKREGSLEKAMQKVKNFGFRLLCASFAAIFSFFLLNIISTKHRFLIWLIIVLFLVYYVFSET